MVNLKKLLMLCLLTLVVVIGIGAASTKTAYAVDGICSNDEFLNKNLLGLPVWYKYLTPDPLNECRPSINFDESPEDIWKIGAAMIEILLRIGGFIVVVWIILTGFMFMTSNGNPDAVKQVRNRLIYAGVGLAIIILSASAVSFIGRRLTRSSAPTSIYESRLLT